MSISLKNIVGLFNYLKTDESDKFFEYVDDNVLWTVMGTHPLAGVYKSKNDFILNTFQRIE